MAIKYECGDFLQFQVSVNYANRIILFKYAAPKA